MLSRRQAVQAVGTAIVTGSTVGGLGSAVQRLPSTKTQGRFGSRAITGSEPVLTEPGDYHLVGPVDSLTVTGREITVQGYDNRVTGQVSVTGSDIELKNMRIGEDGPEIVVLVTDSERAVIRNCLLQPASLDEWQLVLRRSHNCRVLSSEMRGQSTSFATLLEDATRNEFRDCVSVSVVPLVLENSHHNEFNGCAFASDNAVVRLRESHRNRFVENFAQAVGSTGFSLRRSHRNRFEANYVVEADGAYHLSDSDFNSLLRNTVASDLSTPLTLRDSSFNRVLENDFCLDFGPGSVEISGTSERNVVRNRACAEP